MRTFNPVRWRKRLVIPAILCGIGLIMMATSVYVGAIAGGLDPAFGTGGKVFTHITNSEDHGYAMALQADGKIVVAGTASGTDFAVARYNANGSPDMTFDGDGTVVTDFDGGTDIGYAVAIQNDGKIVVAGDLLSGGADFAVARYNTNGSLDTSFDTDGKVTTDFTGTVDSAHGVAIQADGKIVVAGTTVAQSTGSDFAVARYDTNGALDSTFGSGGKFSANLLGESIPGADQGAAVSIQSDGKIVVVGQVWFDPFFQFAIIRCNANGTLDTSFGGDGRVTSIPGNGFDFARAVVNQSDGKIVVAGGCGAPTQFCVVRYTTEGALDGTFGSGGKASTTTRGGYPASMALQADGKIVVGGFGNSGNTGNDFAVARFNPNGSLDGRAITPIGGLNDLAYGVAIQSDGRIVAAGSSQVPGAGYEFAVARYDLIPLHSAPRRFDFDGNGTSELGVIRPSNGTWYVIINGQMQPVQFNLPGDINVPADYNGDGKYEIAIFRNGDWRIENGGPDVHFGQAGDTPVPGDYDGDTRADFAVFRAGTWYVNQTRDGAIGFGFGIATDRPVAEDYDGDGKFDPAVYRDGTWYILKSTEGFAAIQFGISTDRPVPADYDGDDKADVAVYRNGVWYIMGSTSGFQAVQFGLNTDIPVPADYDGDAKADIAVFRDGWWYKLRSSDGVFTYEFWGTTGDIPVESVYVR